MRELIYFLLQLACLSLIVWIIISYVAKSEPIKSIIIAVAAIGAIIWAMNFWGILDLPLKR